jgi:hypothetical protein
MRRAKPPNGEYVGVRVGPQASNCADVEAGLQSLAEHVTASIDSAEDLARRNWVEPVAVREIKSQLSLDTPQLRALLERARSGRR